MKRILIISPCQMRGETTGLIGKFLVNFENIDKSEYEIDLYDTNYLLGEKHVAKNYPVSNYYSIPNNLTGRIVRTIPKIRSYYAKTITLRILKKILSEKKYDLLIVYQIPYFCDCVIDIAHQEGVKVLMHPWGGDILRVSKEKQERLKRAFAKTDYVKATKNSNCAIATDEVYNVEPSKLKLSIPFLSGIRTLMGINKALGRKEMSNIVGIPVSNSNIICGYSGEETQRHLMMIEAFSKNKEYLPEDYQLLFPVTYCAQASYVQQLKVACEEKGLNAIFFTEYLSNDQMAYLHLLADLIIQIQPWDNGSAFMIESLYCGSQIITGKWLNYRQFEQFGMPYHLIDRPEDLPDMIRKIYTGEVGKPKVPQQLIEMYTIPKDYKRGGFWIELLNQIL